MIDDSPFGYATAADLSTPKADAVDAGFAPNSTGDDPVNGAADGMPMEDFPNHSMRRQSMSKSLPNRTLQWGRSNRCWRRCSNMILFVS